MFTNNFSNKAYKQATLVDGITACVLMIFAGIVNIRNFFFVCYYEAQLVFLGNFTIWCNDSKPTFLKWTSTVAELPFNLDAELSRLVILKT